MNYIINKTVLYSPDLKQLSLLLQNESFVILSNQSSRLLVEMIQNNKNTITREYLLKHVWEDYGSVPSNNSLYMAVSELRKAFRSLGVNTQVITTVPKIGFIFDADIDVMQVSQPHVNAIEHTDPSIIGDAFREKKISKKKINSFYFIMLFLLCVFTVSYFYWGQKNKIDSDYIDVAFTKNKCSFFSLGNDSKENQKIIIDFIDSTLVKNTLAIDCRINELNIYYHVMPAPINEIFITSCIKKQSETQITCNTLRTDYD